jgi:MSHA biogenesis protein MshJ
MDKLFLSVITKWLNERDERERLAILIFGCICITVLWYILVEKPLKLKRSQIQHQTADVVKQTQYLQNEANSILIHSANNARTQKNDEKENEKFVSMNIHFASPQGNDELVQSILTPINNVKIMDLQNIAIATLPPKVDTATMNSKPAVAVAPQKEGYQLIFQSDFTSTVLYLNTLEKLPWCLSWDSLEYTVLTYPNAQVEVTLHIVSA